MAEQQEPIVTISVDDVEYKIDELPDNVKALLSLYQESNGKIVEAQRQAAIFDAARRALSDNIIMGIRQWNAQRVKELQAQATNNSTPVQQATPVTPIKAKIPKKTVQGSASVQ